MRALCLVVGEQSQFLHAFDNQHGLSLEFTSARLRLHHRVIYWLGDVAEDRLRAQTHTASSDDWISLEFSIISSAHMYVVYVYKLCICSLHI